MIYMVVIFIQDYLFIKIFVKNINFSLLPIKGTFWIFFKLTFFDCIQHRNNVEKSCKIFEILIKL